MAEHASFSPSKLQSYALCAGKWRAESEAKAAGVVEEPSKAAATGTLRHAIAEILGPSPNARLPSTFEVDGQRVTPTPEDIQVATRASEYVAKHPATADSISGRRWIEEKVEIGKWCGVPEGELWGTLDVGFASRNVLEIVDYKFGRHLIDPADWLQGQAYAVGLGALCDHYGVHQHLFSRGKVRLTIVQPEAPEMVRSNEYPIAVLRDSWGPKIGGIVTLAKNPNAMRTPGEDQCRFCLAKDTCDARNAGRLEKIQEIFRVPEDVPLAEGIDDPATALLSAVLDERGTEVDREIDPEDLGKFLEMAPILEGLIKERRALAKKLIEGGRQVPGFKVVPGRSKRSFIGQDDEIVKKLRACGLKTAEIYPKTLPSVAKMEAYIKGKTPKMRERFAEMVESTPGAPVLAPEGDPRASTIETMFGEPETPTPETGAKRDPAPLPNWMD